MFPDDIVLEDRIFSRLLMHHVESMRKFATSATIVLVPGTEYPYGVAEVDGKRNCQEIYRKTAGQCSTSIGMYAFESDTYEIIRNR